MTNTNDKATILIVDDTPENIDILSELLSHDYKVKVALNGQRALVIANKQPRPDLILLDIMMPDMDGYEVCERLKSDPATHNIPVIFVTAMSDDLHEEKGFAMGAVDYITKPIKPSITKTRVKTHLALAHQNRELEKKVKLRTKELNSTRLEIIQRLGRAAEFKDNETGLHVIRMSHYAKFIAESYINDNQSDWPELLFQAAPMHDIGKIGIPDSILLKKGPLEESEWGLMKQHPKFGAEIIGKHDFGLLALAYEVALAHHERWDGSGYPDGIVGEEIPVSARIVAIADVFDALTTERPYKKAWSVEEAINYIKENSGSHFDPNLVQHFIRSLPRIIEIKKEFIETAVFD